MSVSRRFNSAVLFLALAACGPLAARAQSCQSGSPKVSSPVGTICGTTVQSGQKSVSAYRGIPYAQPPVGQNRWKAPQALSSLPQSPFQATQLACVCPQPAQNAVPSNILTTCSSPAQSGSLTQAEDCLYINVWTPGNATASSNLPVMVFIHGGAFDVGSGESPMYDGSSMAATGNLIVVTFNYRLGALGYLPANGDNNFGLQDQYQALTWVKNNVASFGGNPQNVTVFGESAGAMSVGVLALSLSSSYKAPFQAAIMESNPLGVPYKKQNDAKSVKLIFDGYAQCITDSCLMKLTPSQIVTAELKTAEKAVAVPGMSNVLAWAPIIDGTLLSGTQPIAAARSGKLTLPLILGTNQSEGNLFVGSYLAEQNLSVLSPSQYQTFLDALFGTNAGTIQKNSTYACSSPQATDCTKQMEAVITDFAFTCANRLLAQSSKSSNTYAYQFTQNDYNIWPKVSQCADQACHGDELPFVFNNPAAGALSGGDQILSTLIQLAWTNFGKLQNPNGSVSLPWPAFGSTSNYFFLQTVPSVQKNDPLNTTANCTALWDNIGYENTTAWTRLLSATKTVKQPAH